MSVRNCVAAIHGPRFQSHVSMSIVAVAVAVAALAPIPAAARVLDFGAALSEFHAGATVRTVTVEDGGWMNVSCENHGDGPDRCIAFDSSDPTDGENDLGTPNQDFDGPGKGHGGERGEQGENKHALGNLLIIAGDDTDNDNDGLVDAPKDEDGGGIIWLSFSHAGHLSLTLVDVDKDEDQPRIYLFHEGELVDGVEAHALGNNAVESLDLESSGNVDAVKIYLSGSSGIGAIKLDVEEVGVESKTWAGMKSLFR